MAIITISRGSYSKGKQIAEKVAERLGYQCISRDVILNTSQEFNIPEIKLVRAIHDAPSILGRFAYGKEKFIAFVESVLLKHFKEDNIVYCGLAGQFFVSGVSHVLKVRILADFKERIKNEMERENISEEKAAYILNHDDNERKNWSKHLYGIDSCDPSLYDLVIHVKKISVNHAADIICNTVKFDAFNTTPESIKKINDLSLAADVKAALINLKPDIMVTSSNNNITIKTVIIESREKALIKRLEEKARNVPGVTEVKIDILSKEPMF